MRTTVRVRELLAGHRQAGRDFAAAWLEALEALEPDEREDWLEALRETADVWRAAYEGLPATRARLALIAVGEDPDREVPTGAADPWERACAGCGGLIPPGRQSHARYCGRSCQWRANGKRAPESAAA